MARPALTEEQRRESRRRIREAASALYATSGLGDISARAIAKEAGVSVGTIYSHFGSLAELMQSLWRQPVRQLVADLEKVANQDGPPRDKLRLLMETYVGFGERERAVYRGAFMFVRPESHDKPPAIPLKEAGISSHFVNVISEGQEQGVFRPGDPLEITELLWAGLHGSLSLPDNLDRVAFAAPETMGQRMIDVMLDLVCEEGAS